jgi:hypothetical protein
VWVDFVHAIRAERFLDIVARYDMEPEGPYNRIPGEWFPDDGDIPGMWEYSVSPEDLAVEETWVDGRVVESCANASPFMFSFSVRSPRTDLPILLKRLRHYNKASESAL